MSSAVDVRSLSMGDQLDHIAALEREINRLHAAQLEAINALDESARRSPFDPDKDWVIEDLAAALRLSSMTARDRLMFAREMRRMPRLADLLSRGEVTMMHARVAARETMALQRRQVDELLDRVLARAADQTVGQFARSVRRAAVAVGAEPEVRRARALADRRIASRPAPDGMGELYGVLAATDVAAIMTKVDSAARAMTADDGRTLEQRRADAFVGFVLGTGIGAGTGTAVTTVINVVTVAETTLCGDDDEPAELAGYGPISADHARTMASRGGTTWRAFTADTAGHLLDCGRATRVPPRRLAEFVRLRDATCRFPGCTHPARTAELDHVVAWARGGRTSAQNLQVLCKRHHHLKHEAGWRVHRRPDGTTTWRSPTGHEYTVPPHIYPSTRGPT